MKIVLYRRVNSLRTTRSCLVTIIAPRLKYAEIYATVTYVGYYLGAPLISRCGVGNNWCGGGGVFFIVWAKHNFMISH